MQRLDWPNKLHRATVHTALAQDHASKGELCTWYLTKVLSKNNYIRVHFKHFRFQSYQRPNKDPTSLYLKNVFWIIADLTFLVGIAHGSDPIF